MPTLFRDFFDEAKDVVEKRYVESGTWLLEGKYKGRDRELYVNPQIARCRHKKSRPLSAAAQLPFFRSAISNGPNGPTATTSDYDIAFDVEYNDTALGFKTKTSLSSKRGVDPTVVYEADDHKVEIAAARRKISYEYKAGAVALNDRLTDAGVHVGVAYDVNSQLAVGMEVGYGFRLYALQSWAVGARYHRTDTVTAAVAAIGWQRYLTGICAPVSGTPLPNLKVAVYADCNAVDHVKTRATVAATFDCPFGSDCQFSVKADSKLTTSLAFVRKFADGWTAGATVTSALDGVGLYLARA